MNIATKQKASSLHKLLAIPKKKVNVVFLMQCMERFVFLLFMYLY